MKANVLILSLIAMTFLGACQNGEHGAIKPVAAVDQTVQGPSDGGGGDTCNGKLIESYKVDITQLEEFKEFLQPLTDKTSKSANDQKEKSSSPFVLGPVLKNWYLIDCKLHDIPKERKGLYLETYQAAIHTSREIFIDAKAYKAMAKEEQAKLLLHEMVMAYYMVKYLSLEELCKLSGPCAGDVTAMSGWKMFRPLPYRALNSEDHQKIRNVTAWLWKSRSNLDLKNLSDILKRNDFDPRFEVFNNSSEQKTVELDPQVFVRALKKHNWAQSFPKYCQFDSQTNTSKSLCKVSMDPEIRDVEYILGYKVKSLFVKIKIQRESDKAVIEKELSLPLTGETPVIKLYLSKFGSVLEAAPLALMADWPMNPDLNLKEGMRSQMLFFMLNMTDKENPEFYQIKYQTHVWYSFEDEETEKDGVITKSTYGYSTILDDESETLFIENELPFKFNFDIKGKTRLKSVEIKKSNN